MLPVKITRLSISKTASGSDERLKIMYLMLVVKMDNMPDDANYKQYNQCMYHHCILFTIQWISYRLPCEISMKYSVGIWLKTIERSYK